MWYFAVIMLAGEVIGMLLIILIGIKNCSILPNIFSITKLGKLPITDLGYAIYLHGFIKNTRKSLN